jgi:hypothetical protein
MTNLPPILLKVVQQQRQVIGDVEKLVTEQGKQLRELQQQLEQVRLQQTSQLSALRQQP